MKEFITSPKNTAILGLIGSIIMLIFMFIYNRFYSILYNSCNLCFFGLTIYFVIVLTRMYKQKGNIKIANYTLILTLMISIVSSIVLAISEGEPVFTLNDFLLIVMTLYFVNILLGKIKFLNNKIFAVAVIAISIYELIKCSMLIFDAGGIEYLDMSYLVKYISYITIIPYFYNYYELLLKGGK